MVRLALAAACLLDGGAEARQAEHGRYPEHDGVHHLLLLAGTLHSNFLFLQPVCVLALKIFSRE